MTEIATPLDILDDWIGPARDDAEAAQARNRLWFGKSSETDRAIAEKYLTTLAALASGLAHDWAARSPRARLAAIIALDQFTRNIFRDTGQAFENDALALALAKAGIDAGEDDCLSEVERIFLYLPLEHSEDPADQARSVELFASLARQGRPGFQALLDSTLDYARAHKAVIDRFARFPHRNAALGRASTPEELAYLAKPGAGF